MEFIPNLIDRYGRPIYVPVGSPIPEGAVQVSDEVYARIVAGDSRCYRKPDGRAACVSGGDVWAPTYPGPGAEWTEVTDPAELAALRRELADPGEMPGDAA